MMRLGEDVRRLEPHRLEVAGHNPAERPLPLLAADGKFDDFRSAQGQTEQSTQKKR
jgi:hypothetical protein